MQNGTKVLEIEQHNVLCTGSSGFIGKYVVDALQKRGYTVFPYDLIEGCDIRDANRLNESVEKCKPRWIVHLAAQVFLTPSLQNPQEDAAINIVGTLNVLEAARKFGCGVILSSSGAIYGNNYQYPEPISPYGVSKLCAERYCNLYHDLYGVKTVVFRFSSIYGQGRKKTSINLILDKATKGESIQVTGDGEQTRDYTHVSDVAEAVAIVVEGKLPSGTYDIGTGTATSINELIGLIRRLLKKKVTVNYVQASLGDPKRNELNVGKAAFYGFKAKVPLIDGLKKLIKESR